MFKVQGLTVLTHIVLNFSPYHITAFQKLCAKQIGKSSFGLNDAFMETGEKRLFDLVDIKHAFVIFHDMFYRPYASFR